MIQEQSHKNVEEITHSAPTEEACEAVHSTGGACPPAGSPTLALSILLGLLYLGLLTALVFLPGASLLDRLRWLDSGICAQLPTHSFYPGGQRLPLCARNTGIYLGFMLTLLTLYATRRGRVQQLPRWPIIIL